VSVFSIICAAFVFWLLKNESKRPKKLSRAIWMPVIWASIIGSKPLSVWLGLTPPSSASAGLSDDALLDKALYLFLIFGGIVVLSRRKLNWKVIFNSNRWLIIFFLYLGASVIWADSPFTSLKRWIKDAGNIVMALVILTEEDPVEAVRGFFARCACILIPLSVLIVKYYPHISRRYSDWADKILFVGISTDKNMFAMTLYCCALGLVWMWFQARETSGPNRDKKSYWIYTILLAMSGWLLLKAGSSTALTCVVGGGGILFAMRFPAIRARVSKLGTYSFTAASLTLILKATGLWTLIVTTFAHMVGRDPSFHGRTDIWAALLKEDINPLLGVGYYSFWSPERARRLSAKYFYTLNEAHNGYLETYLNSGVLGLLLLFLVVIFAARWIKKDVLAGQSYGALRLGFLLPAIFYGMSEAVFNRLSMLWFVMLLIMFEPPRRAQEAQVKAAQRTPARAASPPLRAEQAAHPSASPSLG
jgi:exopolysaccharide production protein ExoQ